MVQFNNQLAGFTLPIGSPGKEKHIAVPLKHTGSISADNNKKLGFSESYSLTLVKGERRKGKKTLATNVKNHSEKSLNHMINDFSIDGCGNGKVFVGQRKESFAVNLG